MAQESGFDSILDDLSKLHFNEIEEGQINPISDSLYAEELQVQEVILASFVTAKDLGIAESPVAQESKEANEESSESSMSFCEICVQRKENEQMFTVKSCRHFFCNDCTRKHVGAKVQESVHVVKCPAIDCKGIIEFDSCVSFLFQDLGIAESPMVQESKEANKESSESSMRFCEICVQRKENDQMFTVESCRHFFCNDCISKHVGAKVQESVHVVKCPAMDCQGVIEFDSCVSFMSENELTMWNQLLCESLILDSQKFYCPYKNCSAMLLKDTDEVIREAECPVCRRLFCAQCNAPWHSEIGCEEFQGENDGEREREDFMLRELVKQKQWNRCPHCKFYVEKTEGCLHITCRCGFQFCYACGATWSQYHGGCQ